MGKITQQKCKHMEQLPTEHAHNVVISNNDKLTHILMHNSIHYILPYLN